ncbi:MAG: DUF3482 domain-containing protein [Pirellulales bacterium]
MSGERELMRQNAAPDYDATKLDRIQKAPLIIAVAGHANHGKTSVVRTLCRMPAFGEVKDFPGTTKAVSGVKFKVESEAKTYMIVFDTPGFQNSAQAIETSGDRFTVDDIRRFFQCRQEFSDDFEALKQVLASQVVLYVIDSTCGPTENLESDFRILARSGVPVIPLFNFSSDDNSPEREAWTAFLHHNNYHLDVAYDAHVYRPDQERELYEKVLVLLKNPLHREFFEYHMATRQSEERRMAREARTVMAEMLLDCAAYCQRSEKVVSERKCVVELEATDSFKKRVAERESKAMRAMVDAYCFDTRLLERNTGQPGANPLWKGDSFGKAIEWHLGIGVAGGAAAGAASGLAVDGILGGQSLGLGALVGGVAGGIAGACGAGFYNRKWDRTLHTLRIQCPDNTRRALIERALLLLKDLQRRGMANQRDFVVSDAATWGVEERYNKRLLTALGKEQDFARLLQELADDAGKPHLSMIGVDPRSITRQVEAERRDALNRVERLIDVLVAKLEGVED